MPQTGNREKSGTAALSRKPFSDGSPGHGKHENPSKKQEALPFTKENQLTGEPTNPTWNA